MLEGLKEIAAARLIVLLQQKRKKIIVTGACYSQQGQSWMVILSYPVMI